MGPKINLFVPLFIIFFKKKISCSTSENRFDNKLSDVSGVPLGPEARVDAAVCSRRPLLFPGCASHLKAAGRAAAPLKLRTRLPGGSCSEPAVEPGDGAGEAGMGRQEQEGREGPVVTAQLLQLGRLPLLLLSHPCSSHLSSFALPKLQLSPLVFRSPHCCPPSSPYKST